jgi:4-carboxymuconolactone decarboxylase
VDGTAPRLRPLDPATLRDDQSALYAEITTGPRAHGPQHFPLRDESGALLGPFNAFLLSPALGGSLQALGAAVRYSTDLTPRARELAILVVAAAWNSAFERDAHESVGRAAGLTDSELADIRDGRVPDSLDDRERAVVEVCMALTSGDIDDDTWNDGAIVLGNATVFELSTLVGYYATLALQLRIFRVDGPQGEQK